MTAFNPGASPPPIEGAYLLCVARKDHGKNVDGRQLNVNIAKERSR